MRYVFCFRIYTANRNCSIFDFPCQAQMASAWEFGCRTLVYHPYWQSLRDNDWKIADWTTPETKVKSEGRFRRGFRRFFYSLKHASLMRFHALSSNSKLHLKMKAVFFHKSRCVRTSRRDLFVHLSKDVVSSCHPSTLVYFRPISVIYYGRCRLTLKQHHSCHRERTCRHCVWTSIYSSVGTLFSSLATG